MSDVYFIGGAPRSGKSTALQRFIERRPMLSASTDAIRAAAKSMSSPDQNPTLFKRDRGSFDSAKNIKMMQNDIESALAFEIGQSKETWKATVDFVNYYLRDERDVAIEGVALLPSELSAADFNVKAVYIVNLHDQTDVILNYARQHAYDWLNKYSDSAIKAFCDFNKALNQYYADEAHKYGYPVIELDESSFDSQLDSAIEILLK